MFGGGGGIRTHDTLTGIAVFKTAALDHYATPPNSNGSDYINCNKEQRDYNKKALGLDQGQSS